MIRINLLPIRAFKRRENIRLQISSFLLSLVLVLLVLGFFWFGRSQALDDQLVKKAKVKQDWDNQIKKEVILNTQKETMKVLEKRISLIINLIIQRSGPVRLLDEVIKSTPDNEIWLTELSQQAEKIKVTRMVQAGSGKRPAKQAKKKQAGTTTASRKAQVKEKITKKTASAKKKARMVSKTEDIVVDVLSLKGVAKDNQALALYIEALESSPILDQVQLVNSRQTLINNLRLKRFALKCRINYLAAENTADTQKGAKVVGGRGK